MNIFSDYQQRITAVLSDFAGQGRLPADIDLSKFVVEPPRDPAHGDLATNAAMVYAREAKAHFGNPRALATALIDAIGHMPGVAGVEIAGPGFINIRLKPEVYADVVRASLADVNFGRASATGKVNVEYVSANPTGPMHVGHGRGAVFGDALANLLAFSGRQVTREYYINDAGAQVDVLARSAFLRYREALGETIGDIPQGFYPGDYLKPVGAMMAEKLGPAFLKRTEDAWLPIVRQIVIDAMMKMIRADHAALNIIHEVFFSERTLHESHDGKPSPIAQAVAELRSRDLVYEGRLAPPKGQLPDDWEDREQTLFRATRFGDDVDRPLVKSDGAYTYFAADIAYHKSKIDRGFLDMIDVWGADHGGYVKRMQAAVKAVSADRATLDVRLCQLVKLMRDGQPVTMSKRAGAFVTLREVVDEVGVDAVRFMMLFRKNDAPLEFDLAKVLEQSKDNPVFYVQYAHARGCSVLRQAKAVFPDLATDAASMAGARFDLLTDEGELSLMRLIAQFPRQVDAAAAAHEPHRIAFYVHDLASAFHSHWNSGKDRPQLRFVNEEKRDLSHARMALVVSLTTVVAAGLALLGVSAPQEMR